MNHHRYALLALLTALPTTAAAPPQAYRTPAYFEPNQGQLDPQVKFIARGFKGQIWITGNEIVTALTQRPPRDPKALPHQREEVPAKRHVVRMKLVGANVKSVARGEKKFGSYSNYFIGNDPKQWRSNVPNYAEAWLRDVWPGIDMRFYANEQREFEYDFIVKPGADPSRIRFEFDGAPALLTRNGDVELVTPLGTITQRQPVVRQGARQIDAAYARQGRIFSVAVSDYDPAEALVVDPVLAYSTYLGGTGLDGAAAIAVDAAGAAYVAGYTNSSNFPTLNAFQSTGAGSNDVFVTKLNPGGNTLAYSTYLGGAGGDSATAIAVDAVGAAYVAGMTFSTNLPTLNPFQSTNAGGGDIFITKFAPDSGITLTAAPNPSTLGQNVALTANVNPSTATGLVTFYDSTTFLGTSPLLGGVATLNTTLLPTGVRSLRAYYSGDPSYPPSTSLSIAHTVNTAISQTYITPPGSPFPAGADPAAVTVADFNNDGWQDYAVASSGSNSISVMLGNGSGGFAPMAGSPFLLGPTNPQAIGSGDFNGDGRVDLAIGNLNGTVSVMLNTGVSFTLASYPAGPGPRSLVVADFDLDGKADIVVANTGSSVTFLKGNGNGTFVAGFGGTVSVGTDPVTLIAADFNGDGRPDVATANFGGAGVTVLLNAGGTFTRVDTLLGTNRPVGIAAARFDAGASMDLVVSLPNTNQLMVLPGNGNGTFGAGVLTTSPTPVGVIAGDFTGDGLADVAVTNFNANTVSVLPGNGAGGFAPGLTPAVGANPRALAAGQFDGDPRTDFAVANANSNNVTILLGAGTVPTTITLIAPPSSLLGSTVTLTAQVLPAAATGTVAFFDGGTFLGSQTLTSGSATFFATNLPGGLRNLYAGYVGTPVFLPSLSATVPHLVYVVNSTFLAPASPVSSYPVAEPTGPVVTADFNGDGRLDFAAASRYNGVYVYRGDGKGAFAATAGSPFASIDQPVALSSADLDGDGDMDLVALLVSNLQPAIVFLNNGNGVLKPLASSGIVLPGSRRAAMGMADFNRDGRPDLLILYQEANLVNSAKLFLGNGDGTFTPGTPIGWPATVRPNAVITGDFNLDGNPDFLTSNDGISNLTLLAGDGKGAFAAPVSIAAGLLPQHLMAADLNGDGRLDLVASFTNDTKFGILLSTGPGTFAAPVFYNAPSPYGLSAGDFDGDGDRDLMVTNLLGNTVSVFLNNGAGVFSPAVYSPVPVGDNPLLSALGDFNGDGRLDAVVTNGGSNNVTILLGQTTAATAKLTPTYTVTRDTAVTPNQWVVDVAVTNSGPASQTTLNARIVSASMGGVATITFLPANLGNMPGGTTRTAQLRFPVGGTLVSGAKVTMAVTLPSSLTTGGSFGFVVLP